MGKIKKYLVLDTETASLPFINDDKYKNLKLNIQYPLIYDIGWIIVDRRGNIYKKANYLVNEIFFDEQLYKTAYYYDKKPLYYEELQKGNIKTNNWNEIVSELFEDLNSCEIAPAYNCCFDFKKAFPFTEKYIKALYKGNRQKFIDYYKHIIDNNKPIEKKKNDEYLKPYFTIRGIKFNIADLWGLACSKILNTKKYKDFAYKNQLYSPSKKFFSTNAENCYKFLFDEDFVESHTALSDAIIESQILCKILSKGKIEPTIMPFPFREVGTVEEYCYKYKKPLNN